MLNVKSGRENLALTIFFPYDCNKNCSFCTTKALYKDVAGLDTIIDKMLSILPNSPIKDVVISGGEPLSNIKELHKLVMSIPREYNVFINTSFPEIEPSKEWAEIIWRINGINVSRHKEHDYSTFAGYEHIIDATQLVVPVRVNILVNSHIDVKNIWEDREWTKYLRSIMAYEAFDIQLRANYINTSTDGTKRFTLNDEYDPTSNFIKSFGDHIITGCNVCYSIYGKYGRPRISFHKGVATTLIDRGDYSEVNDVIIYPNGQVKLDWVGPTIDLSAIKWI